jgi:hypothetical protein
MTSDLFRRRHGFAPRPTFGRRATCETVATAPRLRVQRLTGVADRRRRGEAGQFGHRQHRGRRAPRRDGRRPPRPQNDRHIVFGDPGALGDELRGPPRERVGAGRTVTHSAGALRPAVMSSLCGG